MSSVLRPVRKRKKSRKLGPVDVIRREDYGDLELDAKVELIRSLVPLGLMHVEEMLDDEVTGVGRCPVCPQGRLDRGPSITAAIRGRSGLATGQRVNSCPPDSSCRGGRDSAAVRTPRCMARARSTTGADAGAIWDARAGGRGGGDSRGDRAVGVDRVPDVHPGQRRETARVPRASVVAIVLGRQDVRRTRLGITMTAEKRFLGFVETDTENAQVVTRSCGRCLSGASTSRKACW